MTAQDTGIRNAGILRQLVVYNVIRVIVQYHPKQQVRTYREQLWHTVVKTTALRNAFDIVTRNYQI